MKSALTPEQRTWIRKHYGDLLDWIDKVGLDKAKKLYGEVNWALKAWRIGRSAGPTWNGKWWSKDRCDYGERRTHNEMQDL